MDEKYLYKQLIIETHYTCVNRSPGHANWVK